MQRTATCINTNVNIKQGAAHRNKSMIVMFRIKDSDKNREERGLVFDLLTIYNFIASLNYYIINNKTTKQ